MKLNACLLCVVICAVSITEFNVSSFFIKSPLVINCNTYFKKIRGYFYNNFTIQITINSFKERPKRKVLRSVQKINIGGCKI